MNARLSTFLLGMAAAIASATLGCGKERAFSRVNPLLGENAPQVDAGVESRTNGRLEANPCGPVECTGATPQCNTTTHECVPCVNDAPCSPAGLVCDTMANRCVECRDNSQCGGDKPPLCDAATRKCVGCLSDVECNAADASRCSPVNHTCIGCNADVQCEGGALCRVGDGLCVQCLDDAACSANNQRCDLRSGSCIECLTNADCTGNANGPVCKTVEDDGPASLNTCIACLNNADCTSAAASRCERNQCQPCTVNADCNGIPGPPNNSPYVCDTSGATGRCEQCTSTDFDRCATNGAARVCDSRGTPVCTELLTGTADLCEPCIADAQCGPGQLCVEQTFGPDNSPIGFFCFARDTNGACPVAERPYVSPKLGSASIDGVPGTVCGLRLTTCPGVRDLALSTPCTADADCGAADLDDGICFRDTCNVPCNGDGTACGRSCSAGQPFVCE
jgi:hypothetical protein